MVKTVGNAAQNKTFVIQPYTAVQFYVKIVHGCPPGSQNAIIINVKPGILSDYHKLVPQFVNTYYQSICKNRIIADQNRFTVFDGKQSFSCLLKKNVVLDRIKFCFFRTGFNDFKGILLVVVDVYSIQRLK